MRTLALISALALAACTAEKPDAPTPPAAPQAMSGAPAVPQLPSNALEDIDFNDYSPALAGIVGLEIGENRLEATDKIRLFFAPERGDTILKTSSSTFERDDGAVMLFTVRGLADDSVSAQEVFAVFAGPGGDAKFNQKLAAFGMRLKCHRSDNPDQWQTDLCP